MSQYQNHSLPKETFLRVAVNLLNRVFLEGGRTQAKAVFRHIEQGDTVKLTTVEMEDKSTVRFDLALDHSEFDGHLNFSAFRSSVGVLIAQVGAALRDKRDIRVFTGHDNNASMLFGIPAVTGDTPERGNVMVLGADIASAEAAVKLRLMYLDREQFLADAGAVAAQQA